MKINIRTAREVEEETFTLLEFLEEKRVVEYWTSGKNVTTGWVNFTCPFCDDDSNHLGINPKNGQVNCWKCGKHSFWKTISLLTGFGYEETSKIKFQEITQQREEIKRRKILSKDILLPIESTEEFSKRHIDYLIKRKLDYKKIISKYRLKAVNEIGKYKFRIIIPIIMNNKIVSFTSRDITDLQKQKYLTPTDKKDYIYNYDNLPIGGDAILVEGPTDVWRMGDNTISFLGIGSTMKQMIAFKKKKINKLFILFDNDTTGKRQAQKIARNLAPLTKSTEIITLTNSPDPGKLKREEAEIIKQSLGFKK